MNYKTFAAIGFLLSAIALFGPNFDGDFPMLNIGNFDVQALAFFSPAMLALVALLRKQVTSSLLTLGILTAIVELPIVLVTYLAAFSEGDYSGAGWLILPLILFNFVLFAIALGVLGLSIARKVEKKA